jgi:hypothetical protein
VGFVVNKDALRQALSEFFTLHCQSLHQLFRTHHHTSSEGGSIGEVVADVPSGLSLAALQERKKMLSKSS